jgi:hypothetical protein
MGEQRRVVLQFARDLFIARCYLCSIGISFTLCGILVKDKHSLAISCQGYLRYLFQIDCNHTEASRQPIKLFPNILLYTMVAR